MTSRTVRRTLPAGGQAKSDGELESLVLQLPPGARMTLTGTTVVGLPAPFMIGLVGPGRPGETGAPERCLAVRPVARLSCRCRWARRLTDIVTLIAREVPMTLAEIRGTLEHISDDWRSGTASEQKLDLADLDDLLGQLDDLESDARTDTETLGELRGRIEILMDEIEISLGIEPAPFPGLADLEADPRVGDPVISEGQQIDD